MIKYVLLSINISNIGRLSDGLIFCENNEGILDDSFEKLKIKIKDHHRESTSHLKSDNITIRQIEAPNYGIYYKINMHVIITMVVEKNYPLKLSNAFLDTIQTAFLN